MKCPNCGKKNAIKAAIHCEFCGGKLSEGKKSNIKSDSKDRKCKLSKSLIAIRRIIVIVLCVVLTLILAIGIWHIARNVDNGINPGSEIRYYNMWKYTIGATEPYELEKLGEAYARNVTITINEIKDNGDGTAIAYVTVVLPDIRTLLYENMKDIVNANKESEYDELMKKIKNDLIWSFYFSSSTESKDITIELLEKNGSWYVSGTTEIDELYAQTMQDAFRDVIQTILWEG